MAAPTRELLGHFDAEHRARLGVPAYIVGAKHAMIMKRIFDIYGTERLKELISVFFQGNSFADDAGYSVEVFASQVPRTLMQIERARMQAAGTWVDPKKPRLSDAEFFRANGYTRRQAERWNES